jgi:hypothetical protein
MPTTKLSGIIRYLNHVDDDDGKCAICVTSDGVAFTVWSDFLTTTKLARKSQDVTILIDDPVQEMFFLLRRLKPFCPSENCAGTVSFSLHPMAPLMLEYPLQETSSSNSGPELTHFGHAKFYLEALMDDEDHPDPVPMTLSTETRTNTVIEARIEHKKFSQIFEVLAGSIYGSRFYFLGDELHIQTILGIKFSLPFIGNELPPIYDSQNSMADISLSSKGFNFFRCDHPLSFELNQLALNMFLEKTGDGDILRMTIS